MDADDVFDTVSGTLGLTGGVDAIALLKRKNGGVILHIQGRDMVDEVEKAVAFDRETGRWTITGEASVVQNLSEKDRVLKALGNASRCASTRRGPLAAGRGFGAAGLIKAPKGNPRAISVLLNVSTRLFGRGVSARGPGLATPSLEPGFPPHYR
jgi:hypothetical protein